MNTKTDTKLTNPLDDLFDIDGTDRNEMIEYRQATSEEIEVIDGDKAVEVQKNEEDKQIDSKIDAVYDAALETFQNQMAYTQIIEPRYAARNAEVAASYLNIALQAAAARAKIKGDRKRAGQSILNAGGNKITNNTIVASREEILRMISVDKDKHEI
jgi:hypothetical protein